jgi:hypothetical protein
MSPDMSVVVVQPSTLIFLYYLLRGRKWKIKIGKFELSVG